MPDDGTPDREESPESTEHLASDQAGPNDNRFRRADRIIRRPDFVRIQRTGLRYKTSGMTITWLPAKTDRTRIGITVSKKVGNSPIRSRVKRWIREVFRTHKSHWPAGIDFVVIARPSLAGADLERVRHDMLQWAAALPTPSSAEQQHPEGE